MHLLAASIWDDAGVWGTRLVGGGRALRALSSVRWLRRRVLSPRGVADLAGRCARETPIWQKRPIGSTVPEKELLSDPNATEVHMQTRIM